MKQTVSFPARFFAYGIMIVYFLFFQVYAAYAQSGSAYKQVYTTSEGKIQVGTYTRSQVSLRALTPVVPQENDRLQATLDQAAALTKAGDLVIDLSLYPDELFRTRPLYVRNGVKTTFVNGTMVRGVELRDSATLVISHDSRVEWGDGAVLTGESRVAGRELVAVELGSFELTSGEIRDTRDPSGNGNSDAAVALYTEKSQFTLSGGRIVNTLGVQNYGGGFVYLQQGEIISGLVYTPVDVWVDGGITSLKAVINLEGNAKVNVASALHTEIMIWVVGGQNAGPYVGQVVATGYHGYMLSAEDLSCFRYATDENTQLWQFALQNNQIIFTLAETQIFGTGEELQDYLATLVALGQQGTEKDPVAILLAADKPVEISKPLQIPAKAHLAFKGGSLVRGVALRSSGAAESMLKVPRGSSLSLDQTTVDGGKQEASAALVTVSGKLLVGTGSIIKGGNPQDGKSGSGIYIEPTGQMQLAGGQLEANRSTGSGVIENAGELIISSGFVQNNQSDESVVINRDNSRFQMTGGIIEANMSENAVSAALVFGKDCHVSIQKGYIYSGAQTEIDTQSDIHLGGETAIKGNVVLHEGTKLQIGSYLQNDLHLAYQGTDVLPGTVVACGTGDYTLTRKDLDRIINVSGGYDFVLENGSIIIRTTPTGNDEIETATFRAVVQAGCLILSGLAEGSSFRIYDAGGKFVSQGRIQAGGTTCRLPGKGVFFIVGKETYVKVMNR